MVEVGASVNLLAGSIYDRWRPDPEKIDLVAGNFPVGASAV